MNKDAFDWPGLVDASVCGLDGMRILLLLLASASKFGSSDTIPATYTASLDPCEFLELS